MKKAELKIRLAEVLKKDNGRIAAFNSSMEIAEIKFSSSDNGRLQGWRKFVNFTGSELPGEDESVKRFKSWCKEEWHQFVEIANQEGIAAAKQRSCVI